MFLYPHTDSCKPYFFPFLQSNYFCSSLIGDSYLHPIFGDDIPSSAWIISLITQFIPSGSSLVYLVVVSNDCSSPELVIIIYLVSVSRCLSFRLIYPLTTYNPVMDNLPCEVIIYVLTAIDNMSHALLGRSRPPQSSKIHISCGIECPSFNKTAFLALFRMLSVLEHKPIHALVGHPFHTYNPVSLVFLPVCSLSWPCSPVKSPASVQPCPVILWMSVSRQHPRVLFLWCR